MLIDDLSRLLAFVPYKTTVVEDSLVFQSILLVNRWGVALTLDSVGAIKSTVALVDLLMAVQVAVMVSPLETAN